MHFSSECPLGAGTGTGFGGVCWLPTTSQVHGVRYCGKSFLSGNSPTWKAVNLEGQQNVTWFDMICARLSQPFVKQIKADIFVKLQQKKSLKYENCKLLSKCSKQTSQTIKRIPQNQEANESPACNCEDKQQQHHPWHSTLSLGRSTSWQGFWGDCIKSREAMNYIMLYYIITPYMYM